MENNKLKQSFKRSVAFALSFVLTVNPALAQADPAAAIIIDSSVNSAQQPGLKNALNGAPVVDIAEPSAAGVSHNQFTKFNVGQEGVIMNNSAAPILTELGGWADGNRRLVAGEARIILNEVTGVSNSSLLGYTEIAGSSAEYILANPNGIMCNGCGFINTPRVSMITGSADMQNGLLSGFNVSGGEFVLTGAGLNASNIDQFDIVTRAAKINAELYANRLNIITGQNYYNFQDGSVRSISGDDGLTHINFSLDASALGAMYASSIRLIGTEAGVGVNSEGLVQSVGELDISADGNIVLADTLSNDSIKISSTSGSVITKGTTYASNASIEAGQNIENTGLLAASDSLSVSAENVLQKGNMYSGLNTDGSLNENGSLSITAQDKVDNKGYLQVASSLSLKANSLENSGDLILLAEDSIAAEENIINGGTLYFQKGEASLSSKNVDNTNGVIYNENGSLTVNSSSLTNSDGEILADDIVINSNETINENGIFQARSIRIDGAGFLDNSSGEITADSIAANTGDITNSNGLIQAEIVDIIADSITNQSGDISATDLTIKSGALSNISGQVLADRLSITSDQELNNQGLIQAENINVTANRLDNSDGQFIASNMDVEAGSIINNRGLLQSDNIEISADTYTSEGGVLVAHGVDGQSLTLSVTDIIRNSVGATLIGFGESITLQSATVDNSGGQISLGGNGPLTIYANNVTNTQGTISAIERVSIESSRFDNTGGSLTAQSISVDVYQFNNASGEISGNSINLITPEIHNKSGVIKAASEFVTNAGLLRNKGGELSLGNDEFNLSVRTLDNDSGVITHSGAGGFLVSTERFNNNSGLLQTNGTLGVNVSGDISNNSGSILSQGNLSIVSGGFDNTAGSVRSSLVLDLSTGQLTNLSGSLSGQDVNASVAALDNTQGSISGRNVKLRASSDINNDQGRISADNLNLIARTLNNSGVLEGEYVSIASTTLNNSGLVLSVGEEDQSLTLGVSTLENSGRLESYGENLLLQDVQLVSDGGEILHQGAGELTISGSGEFNNSNGILATQGTLMLSVDSVDNSFGQLVAQERLVASVTGLNNQGGSLYSGSGLSLSLDELDNSNGGSFIVAAGDAELNVTGELNNSGGSIVYRGSDNFILAADSVDNSQEGLIGSSQGLELTTNDFNNNNGDILAVNELSIEADTLNNTGNGYIEGGQSSITVTQVDNEGVIVSTGSVGESLLINTAELNNSGTVESAGETFTLNNIGLNNESGSIIHQGSGRLAINQTDLTNTSGNIVSQGSILITTDTVINENNAAIVAADNLQIDSQLLTNQGSLIQSGNSLLINAGSVENIGSGVILAQGSGEAIINATTFENDGGLVTANQNISINATSIRNVNGALQSTEGMNLVADNVSNDGSVLSNILSVTTQVFDNLFGAEVSGGQISIQGGGVNNQGLILAENELGASLQLNTDVLNNTGALVSNGEYFTLDSTQINNSGEILHQGSAELGITATSLINQNGVIASAANTTIAAGVLDNTQGEISAANDLVIDAQALSNRDGLLQGGNGSDITVDTLNNNSGSILALGENGIVVSTQNLTNQSGLVSSQTVTVNAETLNNTSGEIVADQITLVADNLDNRSGVIVSTASGGSEALNITANDELNNNNGLIQSTASTSNIIADVLTNIAGDIIQLGGGILNVTAESINNSTQGRIFSENNAAVSVGDLTNNGGSIVAANELNLESTEINNHWSGTTAGDTLGVISGSQVIIDAETLNNQQGGRIQAETLSLSGDEINNAGLLLSVGQDNTGFNLDVNTLNNQGVLEVYSEQVALQNLLLNNSGGSIVHHGAGSFNIDVSALNNTNGLVDSQGVLNINTALLNNNQGVIVSRSNFQSTVLADNFINTQGMISAYDLSLQVGELNNATGEIQGEYVAIDADTLNNTDGYILASDLSITSDILTNVQGINNAGVVSASQLELIVQQLNNQAIIQGDYVQLSGADLNNANGLLLALGTAGESLQLDFTGTITNSQGVIEAHGGSLVVSSALNNDRGTVVMAGTGELVLTDINNNNGELLSNGDITIQISNPVNNVLNNVAGYIQALGDLNIDADSVNNTEGEMLANGQFNVTAQSLNNTQGALRSLNTADGALNLAIDNAVVNNQGLIEVHAENVELAGYNIDNTGGEIIHRGSGVLSINQAGSYVTGNGLIASLGDVQVSVTETFINEGALVAENNLQITAADTENSATGLLAADSLSIVADTTENQGRIQSETLSIQGDSFDNSNGETLVLSTVDNAIALAVSSVTNNAGLLEIHSNNVTLAPVINNGSGDILHLGNGQLTISALNNNAGYVYSTGSMSVQQNTLSNAGGVLTADNAINLDVTELNNQGGTVYAGNDLTVAAQTLDNSASGQILSANDFDLRVAGSLNNAGGLLVGSADNISVVSGELHNEEGGIYHDGVGTLSLEGGNTVYNSGGVISSQGTLALNVQDVINNAINSSVALIQADHLSLSANTLNNNGGQIQGNSTLALTLPTINNANGRILSLGTENSAIELNTSEFVNAGGVLEVHSESLDLSSLALNNNVGVVNHRGLGTLSIINNTSVQNSGGTLQSMGDVALESNDVINQGGQIIGSNVTVAAQNLINNTGDGTNAGTIAGTTVALTANQIDNSGGLLIGQGNSADALVFNTNQLTNAGGVLRSGANTWALELDDIDNTGGSILHDGANELRLQASSELVSSGTIASTADLVVSANGIDNSGILAADGSLTLNSSGNITNQSSGVISGSSNTSIVGNDIQNNGTIVSHGNFVLRSSGNLSNSGSVVGYAPLMEVVASTVNNSGLLAHNGSGTFTLNAGNSLANSGTIKSLSQLNISASNVDSSGVISASGLNLSGFNTANNRGTMEAGSVVVSGNTLNNQGQLTGTGSVMDLRVSNLNNSGTLVTSSGSLAFYGNVTNSGSLVHAGGGTLTLGNAGSVNLAGGQFATAGSANISGNFSGAGNVFARQNLTIGSSGGTFSNSGSTFYTQGNLDINSAVNNQSGRLIADGSLDISTTGNIDNNSGVLQGRSFNLRASTVSNNNGQIIATGASGTISATDIDNDSGVITAQGALTITADEVSNNNGQLLSQGQLTATIDELLDNANGLISAASLNISGDELDNTNGSTVGHGITGESRIRVDTLVNTNGFIAANNVNLTIDVEEQLDNSGGDILHGGVGQLRLTANELLNTANSQVLGNGNVNVDIETALTNDGAISAAQTLDVAAPSLTNIGTLGSRFGSVSIDAGTRLDNSGDISGLTEANVTATTVANTGTVQSDGIVSFVMNTLADVGEVLAGTLLSFTVQDSVTVDSGETISSAGSLSINTSGNIDNYGTIAAADTLTLGGVNLWNRSSGSIEGGNQGVSSLNFSNAVDNRGSITSDALLSITTGGSLSNRNIIASAGNLTIDSGDFSNGSGNAVFSGGNLSITADTSLTNSGGTLFSLGSAGLNAGSVTNSSGGRIESLGSMAIVANSILNRRAGTATFVEGDTELSDQARETIASESHPGYSYIHTRVTETYSTEFFAQATGADSVIASGSDMRLQGGNITNQYGTISAGRNLILTGNSLSHQVIADKLENNVVVIDEFYESWCSSAECDFSESSEIVDRYRAPDTLLDTGVGIIRAGGNITGNLANSVNFESDEAVAVNRRSETTNSSGTAGSSDRGNSANQASATRGSRESASTQNTSAGSLNHGGRENVNGGNVSIDDESLTLAGALAALGEFVSGILPDEKEGETKRDTQFQNAGPAKDFDATDADDTDATVINDTATNTAEAVNNTADYVGDDAETTLANNATGAPSAVEGQAELAQTDTSDLPDGTESQTEALDTVSTGDEIFESGHQRQGGSAGSVDSVDAVELNNNQAPEVQIVDGSPVELNTLTRDVQINYLNHNGGLFVQNENPDHNYLVEARPEFVEYSNFLGSDYLLDALGYDPDTVTRRLGDAFFETQIVNEALRSNNYTAADTRFVDASVSNDYEQMQHLMDGAVAESGRLELSLGVALTSDQMQALTQDILWMVEEEVDGEKVLVPTLYLANVDESNLSPDGSLIAAGGSINLRSEGDMDTKGVLFAAEDLILSAAGNFTQNASLLGNNISLHSGGDFSNFGSLNANEGAWVNAEGNLLNAGEIFAASSIILNAGNDLTNQSGSIVSDGLVSLHAGNNIVNQQGTISAGSLLDIVATNNIENRRGRLEGNDVSLMAENGDIINRTEFRVASNNDSSRTWTVVEGASTIVSHNSLLLSAGNDLDLQGSQFAANDSIGLFAGNDIHLDAIERTSTYDHKRRAHYKNQKTTFDVVSLDARNNVTVVAGNDLNSEAAQINAGNNIALAAGGDMNLKSVNDIDYRYYKKTKKGTFSKKTTIREDHHETVNGTSLTAGGNVMLNTVMQEDGRLGVMDSGNVTLEATQISAGGDVAIAGEDVVVSAAEYTDYSARFKSKSRFGGLSSKMKKSTEQNQLLEGSTIEASGNVTMIADDDIAVVASDVNAGGHIALNAFDEVLVSAGEESRLKENKSKKGGLFSGGSFYSSTEKAKGNAKTSADAAMLNAGGDLVVNAGSAKVVGSDLVVGGDIYANTDIGDIEILAAKEHEENYSNEKRIEVSFGDALDALKRPDQIVQNDDGQLKVTLASATYDSVDFKSTENSHRSSNLVAGGDITLNSVDDILVEGSSLSAGVDFSAPEDAANDSASGPIIGAVAEVGDIDQPAANDLINESANGSVNLIAGDSVTIKEAENNYQEETKEVHGSAELSVVVQHEAVETAKVLLAVKEAKDQLDDAKSDYRKYKKQMGVLEDDLARLEQEYQDGVPGVRYGDVVEMRELVQDIKDDEEWYQAGVALAAANVAAKTTLMVQQVATAAQSTSTYGFNAGVQLDVDATKTTTSLENTTSLASNITGNNISIVTGTEKAIEDTSTLIQGSNLVADNNLSIQTGTLDVLASRDTSDSSTQTEHGHIQIRQTLHGSSGPQVNASFDRSKADNSSSTYNNSVLLADNITLNTVGDATLRGANVNADTHLQVDVGGSLTVESVQNRSNSRNSSMGISAGFGDGGMNSGGLSSGNGFSVTKETVLTDLTSGGTANINVAEDTLIVGASIATQDEEGNDLGNLNLNTNTLHYADLTNTSHSNQRSAGISSSFSISSGDAGDSSQQTTQGVDGSDLRMNTTSVQYSNSSSYSKSKTLATLGEGSTTIGNEESSDDMSRLNRDVSATNKDFYNIDRQQGNIDLTIDHRMFTEEGRKQIKEDVKRTEILGEAIVDAAQDESVSFLGTGDGETSLREHIGNTQNYFTATKSFTQNPENAAHVETLNNADATPAEKQAAYTALSNTIATEMGLDPETDSVEIHSMISRDPRFAGAYSEDTAEIFINDLAHTTSGEAVNSVGHETQHHIDNVLGNEAVTEQGHENREEYAETMGDATEDYLSFNFAESGYGDLSTANNHSLGDTDEEKQASRELLNNNAGALNTIRQNNPESLHHRDLDVTEAQLLDSFRAAVQADPTMTPEDKAIVQGQVNALACAAVKCANHVNENDPNYETLRRLQDVGENLQDEGMSLGGLLGEEAEGQFEHGLQDRFEDFLLRNDETLTRVGGAGQTVAGALGMFGGATMATGGAIACGPTVGISCLAVPAGAALTGLSAMEMESGVENMLGDYNHTGGQTTLDSFSTENHQGDSSPTLDLAAGLGIAAIEAASAKVGGKYLDDVMDRFQGADDTLGQAPKVDTTVEPNRGALPGSPDAEAGGRSFPENRSTANPNQANEPRNLQEQYVWEDVVNDPSSGRPIPGANNDSGFHHSDGWTKLEKTHELPDGTNISVHYQYNTRTGDVQDIKYDNKQANPVQPGRSITESSKPKVDEPVATQNNTVDKSKAPQVSVDRNSDQQFSDQDFYDDITQGNNGPLIDYKEASNQTNIQPEVLENVVKTEKGQRPAPSTYMSEVDIDTHLSKFDDGAVRFTSRKSVEKYGTAGNSEAFVMPKSEFDRVVSEANGDLRVVEKRLGLDSGYLGDSDTMAVYVKKTDMDKLRIPSGNEGGANGQWVPGGYTSGGVPEAVLDLSETPFTEIQFR